MKFILMFCGIYKVSNNNFNVLIEFSSISTTSIITSFTVLYFSINRGKKITYTIDGSNILNFEFLFQVDLLLNNKWFDLYNIEFSVRAVFDNSAILKIEKET
jgi:hypothetical protein